MDWQGAIARKKRELSAIIVSLQAMMAAGLSSRHARNAVLRILRPAESTLRRVIVLVASTMEIKPASKKAPGEARVLPDFSSFQGEGKKRVPAFRLIDPRKRFPELYPRSKRPKHMPRISVFPFASSSRGLLPADRQAIASQLPRGGSSFGAYLDPGNKCRDDDRGEGEADKNIARRIEALAHALNTLPKQAKRLIRMMERRKKAPPGPGCVGPIRPGLPPGYRRKHVYEIDEILWDSQMLVQDCGWRPP